METEGLCRVVITNMHIDKYPAIVHIEMRTMEMMLHCNFHAKIWVRVISVDLHNTASQICLRMSSHHVCCYLPSPSHTLLPAPLQFMSETKEHWCVGTDDTGDLTTWENFAKFKMEVEEELEEVLLVSSHFNLASYTSSRRASVHCFFPGDC